MPTKLRDELYSQLETSIIGDRLFAQIPDILYCIKNRNYQYVCANRAFADRLNLKSTSSIIGKTANDLFPKHLADIYREQDETVYSTGQEIIDRLELITNSKGGVGWNLASKFPLLGKTGDIIGIASISRSLQNPGDEDLRFAGLALTVEFIQKNYAQDLKPQEMADKINLSTTQLDRRMRKVFKLTTSQFIRKTRLDAAARLLTSTNKPIAQIAQECGYSDQSAFTRQFRATVSLTPSAYRSSNKL